MTWTRIARASARTVLAATVGTSVLAAQARPPAEGARISGLVKRATDDAPVARARVVAASDQSPPFVAITGADGQYALSGLPPGSYRVSVARTGYASQTYGESRGAPAPPVTIRADQQLTGNDFAL